MINVTKAFLPPFEEYIAVLKSAWEKGWITNNGELVVQLESKLKEYLGVPNLLFCNNGTIVLQMALKALNVTGEVITTPFSYVATTTAILWENATPIFVDIDDRTFCIDPGKMEDAITEKTQAILATHVYGYPCDVERIQQIAKKYDLKIIYDGAHAFGTLYNGKALLSYGDISTCSFHATKLFHTGEGGCIITHDNALAQKLLLYRQFGHIGDEYFTIGINGKNSEFHAAMGLTNFNHLNDIYAARKEQWLFYKNSFREPVFKTLDIAPHVVYNYSYFPLVFPSEQELLKAMQALKEKGINTRRYFYPSLNTLSYVQYQACPVSESVARRVLCLPLFYDLSHEDQQRISETILVEQKETV